MAFIIAAIDSNWLLFIITQQLNVSLTLGIVSAALIATQGQVMPALMLCVAEIYYAFF